MQVAAMQDTFTVVVVLVALALMVALWGWWQARNIPAMTTPSQPRVPVVTE